MAAESWLGINLGDILQQTEAIKASQQARQINDFKMRQAQQQAQQEQQTRQQLGELLPKAATGDTQAISQVAGIDPELWMKLDEHQRQAVAEHTDEIGQAIAWADTPQKWDQAVDFLSQKNPELAKYKGHFELRPQAAMQTGALKQFIASQKIDWHQVGESGSFATDPQGNPIGSGNPFAASAPGGAQPAQSPLDPHQFFKDFVLPHEGGYAAHDANGQPVNFGINQGANPGVNVKTLTPQGAGDIFANKYWAQSGAANLPPALAAMQADTAYVAGPGRAQQFLAQSGGDPQKYMQLRTAYLNGLIAKDPAKFGKYAKAWANRNSDLAAYSAQLGGGGEAPSNGLPTTAAPGWIPGIPKPGKDAPSGYQWSPDHSRLIAIPGGPADKTEGNVPIPGDITKTGDAYLSTVPKNLATQIKALSDGRLPLPSSFALKTPYWQQMLQMTAQYDPTFDAANAKTRVKTRLEFTSGKAAANITSFNTVLGHLDNLDKSIDSLNNTNVPFWNRLTNLAAYETGDTKFQKAYKDFTASKNAATRELTRAFRLSSGNVSDIKDFDKELDAADGPEALHETVKKYVDLLASRINALGEQYNAGMGKSSDPINLLDPRARQVFQRLAGEGGGITPPTAGWGKARVVR